MKKAALASVSLSCALLFHSCDSGSVEEKRTEPGFIGITTAQFNGEKMEIGKPVMIPLSDQIRFTGVVVTSPDGCARVSLPVPGLVERISSRSGQQVSRGEVLMTITGNEIIDLQQEFAGSSALLTRLKSEFERLSELSGERIATKKEMIAAESAYRAELAKHNALILKISMVGLDPLAVAGGNFSTSYSVRAPIAGYVTSLGVAVGMHVDPSHTVAEIVNPGSFELLLSVFEKDIGKVRAGQKVEYSVPDGGRVNRTTSLRSVGKAVSGETKSVACYAPLEGADAGVHVNGQFVEGAIYAGTDSVPAVPISSLVVTENGSYVLAFDKKENDRYLFRILRVGTGRQNEDFVELTGTPLPDSILVKGIQNVRIE